MSMMLIAAIWSFFMDSTKKMKSFVKVSIISLIVAMVVSIQSPLMKNLISSYSHFVGTEILTGEVTEEEITKEEKDREIQQVILSSRNIYRDKVQNRYDSAGIYGKSIRTNSLKWMDMIYFIDMASLEAYFILCHLWLLQ